ANQRLGRYYGRVRSFRARLGVRISGTLCAEFQVAYSLTELVRWDNRRERTICDSFDRWRVLLLWEWRGAHWAKPSLRRPLHPVNRVSSPVNLSQAISPVSRP